MAELPPTGYNSIIIDGGALIHTMPPNLSCSTFDDYVATVFCPRLGVELEACDRLDVIWDKYFPKSIKGSTRNKTAYGAGGGTHQCTSDDVMQRCPKARTPGKGSWQILQARKNCLSFCRVRQLKTNPIPTACIFDIWCQGCAYRAW